MQRIYDIFYDLIKALKRSSIKCIKIKWKYLFVEKNDHTNNKKKQLYWILWSRFLFFAFLILVFLLETKKYIYITKYIIRIIYSEILLTVTVIKRKMPPKWTSSFAVPPSDLRNIIESLYNHHLFRIQMLAG